MPTVIDISPEAGFETWQTIARHLLTRGIPPGEVLWQTTGTDDLFSGETREPGTCSTGRLTAELVPSQTPQTRFRVSKAFIQLAKAVAAHRDPARFDLLYTLLWRWVHGEKHLLSQHTEPLVHRCQTMEKAVRRDMHKMKAFVRFREVRFAEHEKADALYIAWFEPTHYIVKPVSSFFKARFHGMNWTIVTPYQTVHWYQETLRFTEGGSRSDVPEYDAMEDAWRLYYASIFNPARLKLKAMQAEMPKKYWKGLPEATLIQPLTQMSAPRMEYMLATEPSRVGNIHEKSRFRRQDWLSHKELK